MTTRRANGSAAGAATDRATANREARGSVHEAIGKLMGDDAACAHGDAERRAGAAAASVPAKTPRS